MCVCGQEFIGVKRALNATGEPCRTALAVAGRISHLKRTSRRETEDVFLQAATLENF